MVDTSLLIYFFGKRGDGDLGFDDFKKFMDNLQTEVLQMEYNEFAKGCATITEMDFARLIYSHVSYSGYMPEGIKSLGKAEVFFSSVANSCFS